MSFVDIDVGDVMPVKPPPIESTPFRLVETVQDLKELAAKLHSTDEFALKTNITSLCIKFYFELSFLTYYVMHGADNDVVWLQRDFGIYICNLFDTNEVCLK
ncbi:hypothetical protein JHK87_012055 [Glycine soja]|nr:hypothetical protein JHK87_012055 [Glycine soja]